VLLDTIVAPITGNQPAAVAVIRVSGSEAWLVASRVFSNWPDKPESHKAVYGRFHTGDDGLALPFAEGHSYTGEETVEFSIHGSLASVRALVDLCLASGARMAEPGEFTQRAFMNGRMDLTQAEGVRDTIAASTELQLRQANLHRNGVLQAKVSDVLASIRKVLTHVEASVDFSEEIGDFNREAGLLAVCSDNEKVNALLTTAESGRILRNGLRIAIVGPPNAGKSSLLNALLGTDRAIVTPIAGTTRDYVEEQAEISGVLCVLIDTAGLRESEDPIELLGIQRSHAMAANADEVWYVYDAPVGFSGADEKAVAAFSRPVFVVANKSDLLSIDPARGVAVSAISRSGFEHLVEHVQGFIEGAGSVPFVNDRQVLPLQRAAESLDACVMALKNDLPDDLLAVGLRDAASHLGEITGETATDDIIDRIFHDFCIGK
jgi:tRNA modification GTPase